MSEPTLDKIIGSSAISQNNYSVHYETGACAFSCNGFLSIVLPGNRDEKNQSEGDEDKRYDISVDDNCREITSLSFSNTGEHLVIGEKGPNARFFITTLSNDFCKITSKIEVKTNENGFSCIAMNSTKNKLVTIGNDPQPFLLLWDTSKPRPESIGYYHLPGIPSHLQISSDGRFAIVGGNKILKFIDINIQKNSSHPSNLRCRNANICEFKNSNFVAVGITIDSPCSAYGLTDNGILCYFDHSTIPFSYKRENTDTNRSNLKALSPIVTTPINLQSQTTSLSLDKKIILVGTTTGEILAIKKSDSKHAIFGQFSSDAEAVVAIGISKKLTASAYNNGTLMFWKRKINSQPILTLPGHRGPVCGLAITSNFILSCGSDSTIRVWELQTNKAFTEKSSQEQIYMRSITKQIPNYTATLTGVRCIATKENHVFAGDFAGTLHVMRLNKRKLEEIKNIVESPKDVLCVAVDPNKPYVGTGGGDGFSRIYHINGDNISLTLSNKHFNSPITAITFIPNGFVIASSEGIKFCHLPKGDFYCKVNVDEAILSLTTLPNGKAVVSGGCDGCISIWLVAKGTLSRKYKISPSSYPLAIAVDKSGLFVAAALSDGFIRLLDIFSGDTIYSFQSHAGIITCITFHENDLLLSSFSGIIMRWTLPPAIHDAISERNGMKRPILPMGDMRRSGLDLLRGSIMKGSIPNIGCKFKTIDNKRIVVDKPLAQDIESLKNDEEEDEVEQAGFDAPRPFIEGEYETRVDDIVRQSFIRRSDNDIINNDNSYTNLNSENPVSTNSSTSKSTINNSSINSSIVGSPIKSKIQNVKHEPSKSNHRHESNVTNEIASNPSFVKTTTIDDSKIEVKSQADEMNRAAIELKSAYEKAKSFLTKTPTCPEEIAAKTMIQNAIDMIKRDLCDTQVTSKIREYAQLILSAVDKI